jgi:hypothetical protein
VFNTPEVVKVYVGSFNTARAQRSAAQRAARDAWRGAARGAAADALRALRAQAPPNLERNPMGALLFEKEQAVRPRARRDDSAGAAARTRIASAHAAWRRLRSRAHARSRAPRARAAAVRTCCATCTAFPRAAPTAK